MTNAVIKRKAEEFNSEYFNSTIPIDSIHFRISKKMVHSRGMYNPGKNEVALSALIMESPVEWEKTLLHELIHAYESKVLYQRPGHGHNFKFKAREIRIRSNGKFDINRTTETQDTAIAEKQIERKASRISNQYMVEKNGMYWFLKNTSRQECSILKDRGYTVYKTNTPVVSVRHCQSVSYLLRARYYYDSKIIKKLNLDCTKI